MTTGSQGMVWNGMEDDFSIFHTGNFLPFHTKNLLFHIPFHTKIFFHIPFHTKIFFHIPFHIKICFHIPFHTKEILDWKQCNVYFVALHLCNVVSNRSWRRANNTKMQRPVSGMHIADGLMHRRSLDFELRGGLNHESYNDVIKSFWTEGLFMGQRMKDQKLGVWFGL